MADKIFLADASDYFYSIAGVNRLVLFFIFIQQLSSHRRGRNLYQTLFIGILAGTVCAVILGLFDYYSWISLKSFRNLDPLVNPDNIQYRLQSTFGHPGWFAEFVTITIPIILVGFLREKRGKVLTLLLFLVLLLCEMALILAKARAGWISYPLTLFFCWLFFYSSRDNYATSFGWYKNKAVILKVCISIPVTIILSLLIISQFLGESSFQIPDLQHERPLSKREIRRVQRNSLKYRMARLCRVNDRLYLWEDGIKVGQESPIWGMGYESFNWQAHNLAKIPKSHYSKTRKLRKIYGTPHNLYVQLFVSNGIMGLLVWYLLVGVMIFFLIKDFIVSREPFHLIVILSTISFHIYGVFQSLQYISCIWLLIFLNFGYTMAVQKNLPGTERTGKKRYLYTAVYVAVACAGFIFYFSNSGSEKIYHKYGINSLAAQSDFMGFYAPENWSGTTFRWSGARAIMTIHKTGKFRITLLCRHPDLKQSPVTVTLRSNAGVLDRIIFTETKFISKKYSIPLSGSKARIYIDVSRTWVPKEAGVNADTRTLGVAVSNPEYLPSGKES